MTIFAKQIQPARQAKQIKVTIAMSIGFLMALALLVSFGYHPETRINNENYLAQHIITSQIQLPSS